MSYTRAKDPLARQRNPLIAKSNGATPGGSLFPTGLPLSTANLYSAMQPRGSLYGLQHSNSVDAETAYSGPPVLLGTAQDPLVGSRVGGVKVFGGGQLDGF